jgi:hypothetical protein
MDNSSGALATRRYQTAPPKRASIPAHWRRSSINCLRTSASIRPLSTLDRVRRRTEHPHNRSLHQSAGLRKAVTAVAYHVDDAEKLIPVNLNTAPVTPDSEVTKDLSTQAQQDVQSITP